jgi:hypothetical protein
LLPSDRDCIVTVVTDLADPLEPGREEASELLRKAAAARAEAQALLARAEERMSEAVALERRIAELGRREWLMARLRDAEDELRQAQLLASAARERGEQTHVEANESLVAAARRELQLAERELERIAAEAEVPDADLGPRRATASGAAVGPSHPTAREARTTAPAPRDHRTSSSSERGRPARPSFE